MHGPLDLLRRLLSAADERGYAPSYRMAGDGALPLVRWVCPEPGCGISVHERGDAPECELHGVEMQVDEPPLP